MTTFAHRRFGFLSYILEFHGDEAPKLDTLILRGLEHGCFSVAREWTDWGRSRSLFRARLATKVVRCGSASGFSELAGATQLPVARVQEPNVLVGFPFVCCNWIVES